MKSLKLLWVAAFAVLLLAAGLYWNNRQMSPPTPQAAAMDVVQASKQVLEAIRARDGERLASWVHPTAGLRFSPYAYVDAERDRKVSSEDVRRFWDDRSVWRSIRRPPWSSTTSSRRRARGRRNSTGAPCAWCSRKWASAGLCWPSSTTSGRPERPASNLLATPTSWPILNCVRPCTHEINVSSIRSDAK